MNYKSVNSRTAVSSAATAEWAAPIPLLYHSYPDYANFHGNYRLFFANLHDSTLPLHATPLRGLDFFPEESSLSLDYSCPWELRDTLS